MGKFECFYCKELLDISKGIWINNGGSWSMVIICEDCYKKRRN